MSTAAIKTLLKEINETLKLEDGDFGFLKAEDNLEAGTCKVIYGKTSSLDFVSETSYADLSERLKSIVVGINSRIDSQNSIAMDFELDYDQERAEPAFFAKNAFSLKNITKFYEGCNLVAGVEFHVKNDAMATVDGVTGDVLRTTGNEEDLKEILSAVKTSRHYFAVVENFKLLPQD